MNVTSTSSATTTQAPTATTPARPARSLDYNAFLQLLIAQMKNQDPTKPMDLEPIHRPSSRPSPASSRRSRPTTSSTP